MAPAFLMQHDAYLQYLSQVTNGTLHLPDFERDELGRVILRPGEVFCRLPGCSRPRNAFGETVGLRKHITTHHGVEVAPSTSRGGHSYGVQQAIIAWYDSLFEDPGIQDPPPAAATGAPAQTSSASQHSSSAVSPEIAQVIATANVDTFTLPPILPITYGAAAEVVAIVASAFSNTYDLSAPDTSLGNARNN